MGYSHGVLTGISWHVTWRVSNGSSLNGRFSVTKGGR
jgi:hypothetical protein